MRSDPKVKLKKKKKTTSRPTKPEEDKLFSMSYSDGGRTKKPKKAKGARTIDKAKRKFSQFKNRKTEKTFKRTRNTNLQDKPRSGNSGMYSKGGFIQYD